MTLIGITVSFALAACGNGGVTESGDVREPNSDQAETLAGPHEGIRIVSAEEGAQIQADPSDPQLIVLDVRTPEEFAEGHLEGAVMIDFYEPDFADRLAELDPDRPYLLYCRSGNRSGQTTAIMEQLGFTNVADIDGGILAWVEAGLPVAKGPTPDD